MKSSSKIPIIIILLISISVIVLLWQYPEILSNLFTQDMTVVVGEMQMKNYLFIILGLIITTIGFAFAFSGINPQYFHYSYNLLQMIHGGYPNLLSGTVMGLGGIAIAITGELYRRRLETRESFVCSSCGKTLQKNDKFCPPCGNEIK